MDSLLNAARGISFARDAGGGRTHENCCVGRDCRMARGPTLARALGGIQGQTTINCP